MSEEPGPWDAHRVRRLRHALAMSQAAFAREIGVRQQTVSDWETGTYAPRGASARVLSLVAERAGIGYQGGQRTTPTEPPPTDDKRDASS
jgi:DNA-binding transcriptional regulator YiaG